jgi:hypothetical protein
MASERNEEESFSVRLGEMKRPHLGPSERGRGTDDTDALDDE